MERHLDVSRLDPPQPMIEILGTLPELAEGDVLVVSHHREPIPLYAQLDEAGFAHSIEKLGEHSYRLKIWKRS